MKKIFIAMLVRISLFSVNCGKNEEPKSDDKKEYKSKPTEKKYLEAGEVFTADNERGTYEFKVVEANYLDAHKGVSRSTLDKYIKLLDGRE